MEERFPTVDDGLAVAEPEPPPSSTRPAPAVRPGSAEAYLELLAAHVRELEAFVYELAERRDELLAEEEHLTARIRVLRRAVQRTAAGEAGDEVDAATMRADAAIWARLWERPPRAVTAATDPTGGRSAIATIAELRGMTERGYVAELRSQGRRRVARWLVLSVAALWISGTVIAAAILYRPAVDEPAAGPDRGTSAVAPTEPAGTAGVAEYVPTTMPDVLGERLSDANGAIADAQLTVVDLRLVQGREGVVLASDPTPGEAVAAGTGVTLSIGRG